MANVAFKEYEDHQFELIQINHGLRKNSPSCILLSPNQIFQVRKTKEKDRFEFALLTKHLKEKTVDVMMYELESSIQVGFIANKNSIRYYHIEEFELLEEGRMCLITLNCHSKFEKQLLEERFTILV